MNMDVIPLKYQRNKRKSFTQATYNMFSNALEMSKEVICPICRRPIDDEFDIGHIISVFHGGEYGLDNLIALHPKCNVGTDNLNDLINNLPKEIKQKTLQIISSKQ